ncbi:endonuclease VII domain-containing protein [Actinomadura welshii]|uniref:endonuclease VII domain-containing protein n=1 Tax=Actinomadura welshii TaxID=3103817 RepID=UPI0009DE7389|nr:endonuclease VII domain-containing protein [Actinomadura madurae]
MSTKRCPDCGETKPTSEFWKLKASKDGLAYYCKICFGLRNARSYRKKQSKLGKPIKNYQRRRQVPDGMKYCARCSQIKPVKEFGSNRAERTGLTTYCRPCHASAMLESRVRNHGSNRNYLLKHRYGITGDEVEWMVAEQGGVCAICLRADAKHVDHDHLTGLVRRILCFKCNGGLGQFHDDPVRMRLAADYLELRGSHARRMHIEIGARVFGGPSRVRWDPFWRTTKNTTQSARHYHLRQKYGINDEDTQWLLKLQVGLCAVCSDLPAEHVDHDHRTGMVRGLACAECNTGMGQLRDDPIALRRAADYVTGRLVKTVTTEDGGTRLSLTVPDVDPASVPRGGWKALWEEDGQYRKETLPFDEELDFPPWDDSEPVGVPGSV